MSDTKKRLEANATIQIDLDQIQLVDPSLVAPSASPAQPPISKGPPPLPPAPIAAAPAPSRSAGKTLGIAAAFVVLLAIAIFAGLRVGGLVGGAKTAASTSAAPVSSELLTVPPVEVR